MLRIITMVPLSWFAFYLALIGIIYLVLQFTGNPIVPAYSVTSLIPAAS